MSRNDTSLNDLILLDKLPKFTDAGNIPLSFIYGGKKIYGIPTDFAPKTRRNHIDCNMVQVIVEGQNKDGLYIRAENIEYRDFAVTEWVVFFENRGNEDTPIIENIRVGGLIKGGEATILHGNGDTCTEEGYSWKEEKAGAPLHITPISGTSCQGAFPYMVLKFDDYEVRLGIGWPTKWAADIKAVDGGVEFLCGQDRCHFILHSGEVFRTPKVDFMIYEKGDEFRGINIWRHWFMKHIMPRDNGNNISPKLCLHYYMADGKEEFTGATEKNQIEALNEYIARGMKPDVWWLDAGWYDCGGSWWRTGNWYADPERFPNGLEPVGKACEENDVRLMLWFEPERVICGSQLRENHPDWLLYQPDMADADALLDLGNPEAKAWVKNHVSNLITEYHVGIYRQDFNFDPLPIWVKNEAEDRIGIMENKHGQGYLEYWDYLLDNHTGLIIDSCAGGGRRNDLETMRRAVPFHYTDVGYGKHPIKQKQHREMFEWIPFFRAHNMRWDNEDGTYSNESKPVDEFAFHCALAPAMTSMYLYNDTEENYETGRRMDDIWREAATLELSGDYYPMTECKADAHDFYAMQFDNEADKKGFVQIISNTQVEKDTFTVKLPCIHDGATYKLVDRETGIVREYSAELLKKGFVLNIPKRKGIIFFYEFN